MLPSIGRLKPAVIFGFTLLSVFSPYILYIVEPQIRMRLQLIFHIFFLFQSEVKTPHRYGNLMSLKRLTKDHLFVF